MLALSLMLGTGMTGCKSSGTTDTLVTIDVKADYPEKEMILQDFMDVEYIPLETNEEFITQGSVMAIGNEFIIVKTILTMVISISLIGKQARACER